MTHDTSDVSLPHTLLFNASPSDRTLGTHVASKHTCMHKHTHTHTQHTHTPPHTPMWCYAHKGKEEEALQCDHPPHLLRGVLTSIKRFTYIHSEVHPKVDSLKQCTNPCVGASKVFSSKLHAYRSQSHNHWLGLARTVHMHRIWTYMRRNQNLQKLPYMHGSGQP